MKEKKVTQQKTSNMTGLTIWKPQTITVFGGMELPADLPEEQFQSIIMKVQEYTGEFDNIDPYIGQVLTVAGMVVHDAELPNKYHEIDPETGMEPRTVWKLRTVLKVVAIDGKKREDPLFIGFVAAGVAKDVRDIWIPRYGPGDWSSTHLFKVRQVPTNSGFRTYKLNLVG